MANLSSFSTDRLSRGDRFRLFAEYVGRAMGHEAPEVQGTRSFFAEAQTISLGPLAALALHAAPHEVWRTEASPQLAARGLCRVVLQVAGRTIVEEDGLHLEMNAGDWSLNWSLNPFRLTNTDAVRQIILFVPVDEVPVGRSAIDRIRSQVFSSDEGLGRVFFRLVETSIIEGKAIRGSDGVDIANSVLILLRAALRDLTRGNEVRNSGEIIRDRVKAIVLKRIADQDLSIDDIADVLNCTKRYIHLAFRDEETSLARFIVKERLARCKSDLTDPRNRTRPISDIAFSCGFKDAAHFSRVFRRHVGMSPTDFRAARRELHTDPGQ